MPRLHAPSCANRAWCWHRPLNDDPDILVCRLVEGKLTLVHGRLWPALAATTPLLDTARLARVSEQHTAQGRHENVEVPFPDWLPPEDTQAARLFDPAAALAMLGPTFVTNPGERKGRQKC
ncbi:MAG: hypothetical protein V7631_3778 [Massilia sp.]|jgi:hypothetical protein